MKIEDSTRQGLKIEDVAVQRLEMQERRDEDCRLKSEDAKSDE